MKAQSKPSTIIMNILNWIEKAGNKLPHPAALFLILFVLVVIASAIAKNAGLTAIHPIKKEVITTVNLLSIEGLHLLLSGMVKNFSGFAPLGSVLVAMLGFSLAERSGLISAVLRILVAKAPKPLIIPVIFLAGILSHTAGDIGYVLLIPLAGMIFHTLGLHPLAGIAACFAAVSGGFAANFILSTADPMLSGISQEAARIIDPKYSVSPVSNWYFMASSSALIIVLGSIITNKITIPFLGKYKGQVKTEKVGDLNKLESTALKWAGISGLVLIGILIAGLVPESGFLREKGTGSVLHSPVVTSVVTVIFFFGAIPGLIFGFVSGKFKTHNDAIHAMQESMVTMAPYLVLVFFAAQFIAFFNASNIGLVLAVHGSDFLKTLGLGAIPLMIGFIILVCVLDLFIGSASAKWTLIAPIFVPMFMLLGFSPELTQASYRIGDSVVNIISPLMSYFPLIVTFMTKYDEKARVGTLLSLMLPYSLFFLLFWSIFLFLWMTFSWQLGPGAGLWYQVMTNP
ncbi:MAG: AbgT family transporter [Proteobacteria bacterium]|nr:AbgT family transporter [Pseudomonadota bacterium]